ncbi:MAG: hypothetical protein ACFFF4_08185 [Candidatus Thorarchaeota archaeon]
MKEKGLRGGLSRFLNMEIGREWILKITFVICVLLGLIGVFLYPLNEQGILVVVFYEGLMVLVTFGILRLIQKRGLEDW